MKITYSTITKIGRRSINQDAFNVIDMTEKGRWMGIVCDGMGGHAMGEMASETVITYITDYWEQHMDEPDGTDKVLKACKKASVAIDEKAFQLHHCEMGTTMAMVSMEGKTATIAHIGDSRCYLIRKGEDGAAQLVYQSKDHHKPGGVLISKCFFSYHPEIAVPDVTQLEVKLGDRILICTDGLYNCVYPHILVDRMMDDKTPEQILDTFAFLCERSGDDNYTAIMAIVEE
mgnify:CR=1 FL=1